MRSYIRTVNGLVNMEEVQAFSWKRRAEATMDDTFPFHITFFLKGGCTFHANASTKSLSKAQMRFKDLWTQEDEPLDMSEGITLE